MAVDYRTFRPVRAISFKGKFLVAGLRFLFRILSLFYGKKWKYPVPFHHEDPRLMSTRDKLYLGYKYYFKAIVNAEKNSGLEDYFRHQNLHFHLPEGFVQHNVITLSAAGDLMPYECINKTVCKNLWDETGDLFFSSDIVFANLETPVDRNKKASLVPEVMLSHMLFNGDEEMFEIFSGNGKYKGYDVLSVANNHSLDQGSEGLKNTMRFLKEKNISYCGAALTEEEKFQFPVLEKNGIKVSFVAFTFSLNEFTVPENDPWLCNHVLLNTKNPDLLPVIQMVKEARKKSDVVVLSLHMGCAYQLWPSQHIVNNVHRVCVETGVEIVLCSHPHNPQAMENFVYEMNGEQKETFIAYSLGDFVAYDIYKWCHLPLMLKLHIAKGEMNGKPETRIAKLEIHPVYAKAKIENGKVHELKFIPYPEVKSHPEKWLDDEYSKTEFAELEDFLETI
ncbi:MAG: CapA family protein [Bacteroidota bacterium]